MSVFSSAVTQWDQFIEPDAEADGVDPNLVRALISAESSGDPNATSGTGAQGLMQLEPGTAAALGVSNAYDPAQNIAGGTKYIAQLLARFKGNTTDAIAAYNAGPNAVAKYGGVPPYAETQNYVAKVQALLTQSGSSTASSSSSTSADTSTSTSTSTNPFQSALNAIQNFGKSANSALNPLSPDYFKTGGSSSGGGDPFGLQAAATGVENTVSLLAAEAFIGAICLAIVAGGFAIAASSNGTA